MCFLFFYFFVCFFIFRSTAISHWRPTFKIVFPAAKPYPSRSWTVFPTFRFHCRSAETHRSLFSTRTTVKWHRNSLKFLWVSKMCIFSTDFLFFFYSYRKRTSSEKGWWANSCVLRQKFLPNRRPRFFRGTHESYQLNVWKKNTCN